MGGSSMGGGMGMGMGGGLGGPSASMPPFSAAPPTSVFGGGGDLFGLNFDASKKPGFYVAAPEVSVTPQFNFT